jgi:hypothetical protein
MRIHRLTIRFSAVMVLTLGVPPVTAAQEPAQSFSSLSLLVKRGDSVQVIDRRGREISGRLVDLSPAGIRVHGSAGDVELGEADLVLIRQRRTDSLLDGTLKGVAIGGGLGLLMELTCSGNSYCAEAPDGQALLGGLVWGTGIGLLVDALHKTPHDVFRAAAPKASLQIAPIAGRGKAGAMVALRW